MSGSFDVRDVTLYCMRYSESRCGGIDRMADPQIALDEKSVVALLRTDIAGAPMTDNRLSIRIDLVTGDRIGPGKIALLEAIKAAGSISAAARKLDMSYRRAWLLVEEINAALSKPAVAAAT